MNGFAFPYGKSSQVLDLPDGITFDTILPNEVESSSNPQQVVAESLKNPLQFSLKHFSTINTVAIAINDKTRPVPHQHILPPLVDWLIAAGIQPESIKFFIATGSHQPMQPEEFAKVVPAEILDRFKIESHQIDRLDYFTDLGLSSRGTPALVNTGYYQADLKIVVGDIEPHHFAGFSGGYKTAAIGMGGRPTINHNHAMLVDPNAWIGIYTENPLRQDIEEIGQKINVHLALNTILTAKKGITASFAGHPLAVMKAGIPVSREVCGTRCNQKYDIVIASAGGAPKDINFYQAQKALTHASLFAKRNGIIILAAECAEGSGSAAYEEFMQGIQSVDDVFDRFSKMEFRVGPHKAFQVARLLKQFQIVLVSSMPSAKVAGLLMSPSPDVNAAFQAALRQSRPDSCTVALLPHATTTIPYLPTGE